MTFFYLFDKFQAGKLKTWKRTVKARRLQAGRQTGSKMVKKPGKMKNFILVQKHFL
jgi:hypothetical protein